MTDFKRATSVDAITGEKTYITWFTDKDTGEAIGPVNALDYIKERDFRNRNTRLSAINFSQAKSNPRTIMSYTKNGYPIVTGDVDKTFWLLDGNHYYEFFDVTASHLSAN